MSFELRVLSSGVALFAAIGCDSTSDNCAQTSDATVPPWIVASATPDPRDAKASGVRMRSIQSEGELCPADSVSIDVAKNGLTATVAFSAAELMGHGEAALFRASCRLSVALEVPRGVQFTHIVSQPAGYAYFEEAGVELNASYSFAGAGGKQRFMHELAAIDLDYIFTHALDSVWSPTCDSGSTTLWIDLDGDRKAYSDGYLNIATVDLTLDSVITRPCPSGVGP